MYYTVSSLLGLSKDTVKPKVLSLAESGEHLAGCAHSREHLRRFYKPIADKSAPPWGTVLCPIISVRKQGLYQPKLPCQTIGDFLEGKPGEIIFQIAIDSERFADTVRPILSQFVDLVIVRIEERMGISVVDQASDHAANTAVTRQVIKKASYIIASQRLLGHLGSDIATAQFLLKKISDFRIPAYNVRIHVNVD